MNHERFWAKIENLCSAGIVVRKVGPNAEFFSAHLTSSNLSFDLIMVYDTVFYFQFAQKRYCKQCWSLKISKFNIAHSLLNIQHWILLLHSPDKQPTYRQRQISEDQSI